MPDLEVVRCRGFFCAHMPTPNEAETRSQFVTRCMADPEAVRTFRDADQRLAFCHSTFDRASNMKNQARVAMNLTGPVRRVSLMGREYISVPAVLVKSQVLQNNLGRTFLPEDAITPAWASMVNGSPVVTDHPNTSARSPEVLNALGVGFLFNAQAAAGMLRADVLLDPGRVSDVPDVGVILKKLEDGQKVEVSTGFPVDIQETPGVANGKEYDRIIQPMGFDHLAVFAEQIGACSVTDGCGLAQNHDGPCQTENQDGADGSGGDEEEDKVAIGFFRKVMAFLNGSESTEKGAEGGAATNTEGKTMNRSEVIARLAAAGPLDEEALNKLTDCQLRALDTAGDNNGGDDGDSLNGEGDGWDKARKYRAELEALRAETATARNAEEKERADLLDDLLYNVQSLPYTEDELKGKGIVELRKIHKMAFPQRTVFSGRGGPVSGVSADFSFASPIMDGPAGQSILDRKEH